MPSATIVAPAAVAAPAASSAAAGADGERLPLELDAGLLLSVDPNPLDSNIFPSSTSAGSTSTPSAAPAPAAAAGTAVDEHLLERVTRATQSLFNAIFSLPVTRHPDHGPIATLPPPLLLLPREKPLPQPKPLTKWEKFARAKGITKRRRDRMEFDEDVQEWVPRWGYKGANKKEEEQWLHPVKANADDDYSPARAAKRARKDRKLKNEAQRLRNLQRAAASTASATTTTAGQKTGSSSARMGGKSKEMGGKRR